MIQRHRPDNPGRRGRPPRRRIAATVLALIAGLALLAGDSPSHKPLAIHDLSAGPVADHKQGVFETWQVAFRLRGADRAEHVDIAFRPGVTQVLDGLPTDGTQVIGDSVVEAVPSVGGMIRARGEIRLIKPRTNEVARVAMIYRPRLIGSQGWTELPSLVVEAGIHVRSSDAQMAAEIDMSAKLGAMPFRVRSVEFRLFGSIDVGGRRWGLTKNPDDRKPSGDDWNLARVTVRSASGKVVSATSTFVPEAGHVALGQPTLSFPGEPMRAGQPTPLEMQIDIPLSDPMATLKTVEVAFPPGLAINATVADGVDGTGLKSCSDQEAGIGNNHPPACPPESVVAYAASFTPTVGLLEGTANLAAKPAGWTPGQPFRLFELVAVKGHAEIKVFGEAGPDPARPGALRTRFDSLPKVPISQLRLKLSGGPHAPLVAPDTPGVYAADLRLTTWANPEAAPTSAQGHFTVVDSPRLPFAPELSVDLGSGRSPTVVSPLAGSRTDATFVVTRPDGAPDISRFRLSLPAGLVASLAGCTVDVANTTGCETVGKVWAKVGRGAAPIYRDGTVSLAPPSADDIGGLSGGVRVDVGGYDLGTVPVQARFRQRPGEVAADVDVDLPPKWGEIPLSYREVGITLQGLTWQSTNCAGKEIRAQFWYPAGTSTDRVLYVPHGCPVPFNPGLRANFEGPVQAGQPVGLALELTLPRAGENRLGGAVRSASFLLPSGMSLSPGVVNGSSRLGTVEADTVEVRRLVGDIWLAASPPGDGPLRALITLRSPGRALSVSLPVLVIPDAGGRVRMVVDGVPEAALKRLRVTLFGGPNAAFTAPSCGNHDVAARLQSWSGGVERELRARLDVPPPCWGVTFNPGAAVDFGLAGPRAARSSSFVLTVTRPNRDADIAGIETRLPAGLVARLGQSVGGRIGDIRVVVGTGTSPVELRGTVVLSQPLRDGRAMLTGIVRAKVGSIDRGTATVSIMVELDASLRVIVRASPPRTMAGLVLHYRLITLSLDQGLVRNASTCTREQIAVTMTAADGRHATHRLDYEPSDCGGVVYTPQVTGSVQGNTGLAGHPELTISINQGDWQAATRHVIIDLPPLTQLLPNPAAAGRVVGDAKVVSPAISGPLVGSVRLIAEASGLIIEIAFRGQVNLTLRRLLTVSPYGRIRLILGNAPDLPVTSLTVRLFGGPNGALIAPLPLCGQRPTVEADLTAHSGHSVRQVAALSVLGC